MIFLLFMQVKAGDLRQTLQTANPQLMAKHTALAFILIL